MRWVSPRSSVSSSPGAGSKARKAGCRNFRAARAHRHASATGDLRGHGAGPDAGRALLHRRSVRSLFGRPAILLRHFLMTLAICIVVFAVTALIPTPNLHAATQHGNQPLDQLPAAGARRGPDPDRRRGGPVPRLHAAATRRAVFLADHVDGAALRDLRRAALPARDHGRQHLADDGRGLRLRRCWRPT
jgi:hypothetical protein